MVDFIFFEMIEYAVKLSDHAILTKYPVLEPYHGRVKNLPGMKEFYESDRSFHTPYVFP